MVNPELVVFSRKNLEYFSSYPVLTIATLGTNAISTVQEQLLASNTASGSNERARNGLTRT
jgi:hypothetical protein